MELWEVKEIENKNFRQVAKLHPQLFRMKSFVDDTDFLEKYGIFIPQKKKLPLGYLKLWPQDFIVEEITLDGEWTNVFPEKFMHKKRDYLPEDPVIYATLVKCGLSTLEVVQELARKLGINVLDIQKTIKFSGIKDKHAITSQFISIKGISADKLYQIANPYFFIKNVFSGKKELFPGGLKGNQFTILIRTGPDFKEKEFLPRLKQVEKNGFYNFFYLQRFGIPRLINPYCGLAILKGDYARAIKIAVCRPGERELFYFQSLRKEIEKLWGDWQEIERILELFPFTFQDERELVSYLIQKPGDFIGALNQVPRVVQLWLTSFAGLLFNQKLTLYLKASEKPPQKLPLVLSSERKDWIFYEELLKKWGIFSQTFALKNLKPFPKISLRRREQKTKEKAEILNYKIIPQGVILNFNLPKDCYVNTFLSHLFTLVSGALPKKFVNLPIDLKANLNQTSLEKVLDQFSNVVSTPFWQSLWRI